MTATEFSYRNKANGLVGSLTPEQASLFPNLLELVEDAPAPADVTAPANPYIETPKASK